MRNKNLLLSILLSIAVTACVNNVSPEGNVPKPEGSLEPAPELFADSHLLMNNLRILIRTVPSFCRYMTPSGENSNLNYRADTDNTLVYFWDPISGKFIPDPVLNPDSLEILAEMQSTFRQRMTNACMGIGLSQELGP